MHNAPVPGASSSCIAPARGASSSCIGTGEPSRASTVASSPLSSPAESANWVVASNSASPAAAPELLESAPKSGAGSVRCRLEGCRAANCDVEGGVWPAFFIGSKKSGPCSSASRTAAISVWGDRSQMSR